MKAIMHPRDGLMLVPDDAVTDPSVTYPFEDAASPEPGPWQRAVSSLVLEGGVVRRVWDTVATPVPAEVLRWQFLASVKLAGFSHEAIEAMIASLEEPLRTVAQSKWSAATQIRRDNPLINQLGAVLGLTTEQIDQVFRVAAALE